MIAVTLDSISKSYGKTIVLDNISLKIEAGSLFFLLGPSGCGKTTLLRILSGFCEATAGNVYFNDKLMNNVAPDKRETGMVFQSYALWPHMTVSENIGFGLDVRKVSQAEKTEKIKEIIKLMRLTDLEARFPHELSGGQQQRVALARALVVRPGLLLLDEPLSNLDAGLRLEMRSEINRIHKQLGITMIYVTHDQKEALSLATNIAIINQGKIEQVDTPHEIYHNPKTLFVSKFIGETNLLKAQILEQNSEMLKIKVADTEICLPKSRAQNQSLTTNQTVTLSIRPEAFQLCEKSEGIFPFKLMDITFLGETLQLIGSINNIDINITQINYGQKPPKIGELLYLKINADLVSIL